MPFFLEIIKSIKLGQFSNEMLDLTPDECQQKLTDVEMIELAAVLKAHPFITKIDLSYNNISDVGVEAIAAVDTVEELNFSNHLSGYDELPNLITARGAAALAKAKLKRLTLHGNPIGDAGLAVLALSDTLLELDVSDCGVAGLGVSEFFSRNTSVHSLNLASNVIDGKFLDTVSVNHVIRTLNLSCCFINSVGAKFLSRNDSLEELQLANNDIGAMGAQALACHPRLNVLNLSECKLDDSSMLGFSDNTSITDLCLSFNKITASGLEFLFKNKTLKILDVSRNNIDFDSHSLKRLARMSSLAQICARSNRINPEIKQEFFLSYFGDTSIEIADFNIYCPSTQKTMTFCYSKKRHRTQFSTTSEEQPRLASEFSKKLKL